MASVKLTIYTDGAARGNPGSAAYGFTISNADGILIHREGKYIGEATNNVAEYTAVLCSLQWVEKYVKEKVEIELFVDSKLVAEQLTGKYRIKAKHLKPIIEKIQILSLELGGVVFSYVPRTKNTLADKLANQALDSL